MAKGEDLINAIKDQNFAAVQKLLHKTQKSGLFGGKKINIDYQMTEGTTALHHAAMLANTDLVCLLLRYEASVNIQDKKGMTPLHYACWQGKLEPVEALLKTNALPNVQAKDGRTPLHFSSEFGHFLASRAVLQSDGDPSIRDSGGKSAFDVGAEYGRSLILDIMLMSRHGMSIINRFVPANNHSSSGKRALICPLHLAARNGHNEVIKLLLHHGIDVNWKTLDGSCLHEAILNGHVETVDLLIKSGADLSIKNRMGMNPIEYARSLLRTPTLEQIINLLQQGNSTVFKARAVKDFNNILDPTTLSFTRGTIMTVVEKSLDGDWVGKIKRIDGSVSVGTFPASYVEVIYPRRTDDTMSPPLSAHTAHHTADSDDSGIHQYGDYDDNDSSPRSLHRDVISSQQKINNSTSAYVNVSGPLYPTTTTSSSGSNTSSSSTSASSNVANDLQLIIRSYHQKHQNQPGSTRVFNPSYDDVIVGQQGGPEVLSNPTSPTLTTGQVLSHQPKREVSQYVDSRTPSSGNQTVVISRPQHINNPGYEDVIIDQRSQTPTTDSPSIMTSYCNHNNQNNHYFANNQQGLNNFSSH